MRFLEADATRVPLPDREFTACISQEAFVHIEDKWALFAECFRLLGEGGVLAFTDWTATPDLSDGERRQLRDDFAADGLVTVQEYREALEANGFASVGHEDLSLEWARILRGRLEMYRSLREETVTRFGEEHYRQYDCAYATFVALVEAGRLGGARLKGVRPTSRHSRAD